MYCEKGCRKSGFLHHQNEFLAKLYTLQCCQKHLLRISLSNFINLSINTSQPCLTPSLLFVHAFLIILIHIKTHHQVKYSNKTSFFFLHQWSATHLVRSYKFSFKILTKLLVILTVFNPKRQLNSISHFPKIHHEP
jgi:hypothetical protein